ncbi:MAG TPA: hypothetical protein VNF70_04425 [Pyrinomonadaceae bacterium]|nr:hypothetical protein [Pyrinomonadaceae bacterium]
MRFCSRCGFAMEGTMHVLAHGGMLPSYQAPPGEKTISPRRRGVKQGVLLVLLGMLVVPILGIMANFAPGRLENVFAFFAAVSAIICFVGGPLRMLFAAIFEEGAPPKQFTPPLNYTIPAQAIPQARVSALPPAPAVNPASQWRQRPQTAELNPPGSVTDSTTQLLDREPRKE